MIVLSFFSFCLSGAQRSLPSFPTRRSSDLRGEGATLHDVSGERFVDELAPRTRRGRSEEHTSELQSPVHLVCSLLLEKKNGHDWLFVAGAAHRRYGGVVAVFSSRVHVVGGV